MTARSTTPTMRDIGRKTNTGDWRAIGVLALIALLLLFGIFEWRHKTNVATPQAPVAAAPAPGQALPQLSSIAQRPGPATLSLDAITINGKTTVVAGLKAQKAFVIRPTDKVALIGWAFDPAGSQPAGGVILRFGNRNAPADYGLMRPDVATAFKSPSLEPVGFDGQFSGRNLRPGANAVSLVVYSHDREGYYVNPSDVVLNLR